MAESTEPLAGALDGVRVVEFAQNAAIPQCGRLLAGLGADVVKVEPPSGDAMRRLATLAEHESRAYAVINPGKRAIALDLAAPEANVVIDALFEWADVALVAFKLPDLERYGLSWDHAKHVNPRLVHVTHTALGPDGPDALLGGYEVLAQGRSGVGYILNRSGATAPMPSRPAVSDFASGFSAAYAVLAGLRHRDLTGEGQRIDTSLLGTMMNLGIPLYGEFEGDQERLAELNEDVNAVRQAGLDFDTERQIYEGKVQAAGGAFQLYFRHYRTADGLISLAGLSPGLIAKFHDATGIAPPTTNDITDPAFLKVVTEAEQLFAGQTTTEWLTRLRAVGYPCGPYNMPHQAMHDPHALANGYAVELEHRDFGAYTTVGMPFQMEKSSSTIAGPSPGFAEHTTQVMADIGLAPSLVEQLVAAGVLLQRDQNKT